MVAGEVTRCAQAGLSFLLASLWQLLLLLLLQVKFGEELGAAAADNAALVSLLVDEQLPRKEGTPLVEDWDCLRVSPLHIPLDCTGLLYCTAAACLPGLHYACIAALLLRAASALQHWCWVQQLGACLQPSSGCGL